MQVVAAIVTISKGYRSSMRILPCFDVVDGITHHQSMLWSYS